MNRVLLHGRLGQDPELKQVGQSQVCTFSLATQESWTDKSGEKQSRVTWHRVVSWGRQAELCATFLRKGRTALVEGSIQTREYESKSGEKRTAYEIKAQHVEFTGGAKARDQGAEPDVSDESVPF